MVAEAEGQDRPRIGDIIAAIEIGHPVQETEENRLDDKDWFCRGLAAGVQNESNVKFHMSQYMEPFNIGDPGHRTTQMQRPRTDCCLFLAEYVCSVLLVLHLSACSSFFAGGSSGNSVGEAAS